MRTLFLRGALGVLALAFLLLAPSRLLPALAAEQSLPFETERPAWTGVLTIWHVVGFKPYAGSISAYLESCAAAFEREHPGIYIEVLGMDEAQMEERLARGERPDLWSFPAGALYPERLAPLALEATPEFAGALRMAEWEGIAYAAPYLYSAPCLLINADRLAHVGGGMPEAATAEVLQAALSAGELALAPLHAARLGLSGTARPEGDFDAGQAIYRLADARAAGDLDRKSAGGTARFAHAALPLTDGFTDAVQYLGLDAGLAEAAFPYAQALIAHFLAEKAQGKLAALGALPAIAGQLQPEAYAEGFPRALALAYPAPSAPDPFLYERHMDALLEEAARAMAGDAEAQAAFEERLRGCMIAQSTELG